MRRLFLGLIALVSVLFAIPAAEARVVARVDVASQTMTVSVNGEVRHVWRVSTARAGKVTPRGQFRVQAMRERHVSSIYGSAMPYSIFFRGNYAIHGTNQVNRLGRPASAGCVRLHTANARQLFQLARQTGPSNLRVVVG